jgi:hypothetical protein
VEPGGRVLRDPAGIQLHPPWIGGSGDLHPTPPPLPFPCERVLVWAVCPTVCLDVGDVFGHMFVCGHPRPRGVLGASARCPRLFCGHLTPPPPPEQKLYEQKAYKKAVKEADKVLKAHPNHGGTTAMKALCVSLLGRRDEAMVLARAAVSYSIRCQLAHAVKLRSVSQGRWCWKEHRMVIVCTRVCECAGTRCAGTCTAC